ncbi:unnamed protein product [Paramecium pentaurelia]|uniref:Uncharacterized protein n=1 Tax=Paramecium pentaurelia TaxID=43138 RepID=A0A8S1VHC6_9CILI|nr:unnamed protein product [Paramecium pentaurelia]
MSNDNNIERHKRILNIVSHLGLNKKKSSIPAFEKKRLSQTRIVFYKPEQQQEEEEDQLIIKAKELLSKPVKRKQIRSESQLVQMISDKYNMLKDDADENSAYNHIQLSLLKLQEQEILGQYHELKPNLRMSKTTYPLPITVTQQKVQIQNMFEKKCSQHIIQSPKDNTIRQKINDFLYKTRESFKDFQVDVSHYKNLKQHHRLYKQRTASYFQQ